MIRSKAISIIASMTENDPVISANGFISRDLQEVKDRPSNFYMIGSMGLASSIGLGVALKKQNKKVYILDGDGNILMNLGSLATIGLIKPRNLVHIVLDNKLHESTGGQPTSTMKIDIAKLAKASNYKVFRADSERRLGLVMREIAKTSGPIFIHVLIQKSPNVGKRISHRPLQIKKRFMRNLK